jgi:hypothetical protein
LLEGSSEDETWAGQFREKTLGASTDYLAGEKAIGELHDDELGLLSSTVFARERYASYLVDQLSADAPVSFEAWANRGESSCADSGGSE